ncbi:MAG: hypothetical protein AB8I69_07725 [Anaerolineae bacterium]
MADTPILKQLPLLYTHLRRWGLRLRLVDSLFWGPWGGAVGLSLSLLLALAARLWPLLMSRQVLVLAGLSTLIGTVVGLAIAWLRPRRPLHLARVFDRRLGLAERLSTAVEIGTGRLRTVPVMAEVQLADTLDVAQRTDHRALLPLRASRPALGALFVLMAGLTALLLLPNPQEDVLLQQAAVQEAIEAQIENLEAVKEEVAQADGLTDEDRETLLEALEEAITGLEEGKATLEEAVAALSEAEQALAELQDPGAAGVQAGLERAAEGMEDSALTEEIAEALARGD